jgi:O-antigen ligase
LATLIDSRTPATAITAPPGIEQGRLWLSLLLVGFLGLGLFFKSFLFVNGEPVAISYAFNGIFIVALLATLLFLGRLISLNKPIFLLFAFALAWATISSWASGIAMNYVATFSMLVMLAGCFYALPLACLVCRLEPWRLINTITLVTVVLSAIMAVVFPYLTVDAESGRFSGFFVSVAIACNFFLFSSVLSSAAALRARTSGEAYIYLGLAALSFLLMFLTRTRSVLIETLLILMILGAFSPMKRGLKMLVLAIGGWLLVLAFISGTAVTTGLVSIDQQLQEFRLANDSIIASRNNNWDFGLQRIAEHPFFGEGLLTKQTEGGTKDIDLSEGGSYNQFYDPHSLPLSLAVEGGIPFMLAVLGLISLILVRFIIRFGIARALQSPDFIIVAVHFAVMTLAGGDLTTLGNIVEKVFWMLVGSLELKNRLVAHDDIRYAQRQSLLQAAGA